MNVNTPIPHNPEPDWQGVSALPIAECNQPLQALGLNRELTVHPAYYKLGVPNAIAECYVRSDVFERLLQVSKLLPDGIRLVVLDAWRPFGVQQYLYDSLWDALRDYHPQADTAQLEHLTRQFVSPPSTSRTAPSPHLTGGAVDVSLCDEDGRWLDMGTGFDEASPLSASDYFEHIEQPDAQQTRVRDNRRILYNAMHAAGFTNLPSEWWHYDYGDQLWAWHKGLNAAIYGPTQVQSLDNLWRQQLEKQMQANQGS